MKYNNTLDRLRHLINWDFEDVMKFDSKIPKSIKYNHQVTDLIILYEVILAEEYIEFIYKTNDKFRLSKIIPPIKNNKIKYTEDFYDRMLACTHPFYTVPNTKILIKDEYDKYRLELMNNLKNKVILLSYNSERMKVYTNYKLSGLEEI
ncbi:hypothetical protein PBI_PBS1_230 [Bacillus phage PBS1]|uniref:Uncharacterized protein n=1 Tax=Bacillus phage PBS1 TaxID=2884423 RepID=A0A223LEV3_BPPB1|nr:hypothetical protein FK780_gp217 [Bacillus phage PBS1]ASU00052.1 hypothetical protein PBI_PBS1_230 [Bacillus phage PBS1]BDE75435.1 hypothetical protein [Bacillus phage PBS1]